MSEPLKKLKKESEELNLREPRKFTLIFMDGTTEEVKDAGFTFAWITGKIRAAEKKTYLLRVE